MIARRYSNYGQVVAVRCDSIRNLLMLQYKQESVTKLESDQLKAYADALAPAADDVYGQEYAAFVRALQAFRAADPRAAADSGSFLNLPETMSDTVLDVVKNTNEYQRVYAYLAADRGLMQKYGENEWSYRFWTWTPQQLEVWVGAYNQLREAYHRLGMWNEVGGEALDADYEKVSDILTLYGDAPYFDAENPSFFRDYNGPVAFGNHVFRFGTREDYQAIYEAWDENRGWKTCLEGIAFDRRGCYILSIPHRTDICLTATAIDIVDTEGGTLGNGQQQTVMTGHATLVATGVECSDGTVHQAPGGHDSHLRLVIASEKTAYLIFGTGRIGEIGIDVHLLEAFRGQQLTSFTS